MDAKEILEAIMMLCFGASWPMQIIKTVKVKNPAGKSFLFLFLLLIGYFAGIAGKLAGGHIDRVIWLYILNALMVGTDITLSIYYLNRLKNQQVSK